MKCISAIGLRVQDLVLKALHGGHFFGRGHIVKHDLDQIVGDAALLLGLHTCYADAACLVHGQNKMVNFAVGQAQLREQDGAVLCAAPINQRQLFRPRPGRLVIFIVLKVSMAKIQRIY